MRFKDGWWRIVPKRSADDIYVRRFDTRGDALATLTAMRKRHTYKVVPYNEVGKQL